MKRNIRYARKTRQGAIVVLAAFMMVGMLIFTALAIDIGYLLTARSELQRSADAAAMAAAWELADEGMFKGDPYLSVAMTDARSSAITYAGANAVCTTSPTVQSNIGNQVEGDIVIGHLVNLSNYQASLDFTNPSLFNAVTVRVRRNENQNGLVPSFFAKIMGVNGFDAEAEATAALCSSIRGFRIPPNGKNLEILPFALDQETWKRLCQGDADDSWEWDSETGEICPGCDGIKEINLYPLDDGPPGNRGTIDIGSLNNSTEDIARQIVDGVSKEDLEYHNGELALDDCGELPLNGDTGISSGVKDELESIKGKPRVIPIFREVNNPGENAIYTIVDFAGIRIMEVKLTGKMGRKRVIIQPAPIVIQGGIQGEQSGTGNLVFTPVQLVR